MTTKLPNFLYYGVSSDEKPIGCDNGCAFIEADTDNVYIWRQEEMAWIQVGSSLASAKSEIASAYEMSWEDTVVRRANKLIAEYPSQITCIACGTQLKSVIRGRRKYCSKCGVYLPKIIYDKSA